MFLLFIYLVYRPENRNKANVCTESGYCIGSAKVKIQADSQETSGILTSSIKIEFLKTNLPYFYCFKQSMQRPCIHFLAFIIEQYIKKKENCLQYTKTIYSNGWVNLFFMCAFIVCHQVAASWWKSFR